MLTERRVVLADPAHGMADRPGDADAGAFRCRTGPPITPAEADSARQLADEEVTFRLGLDNTSAVAQQSRILEVLIDLGKPPAVGVLGLGVEKDTRVPPSGRRQLRIRRAGRVRGRSHPTGHEVEDVELPTRMREEPRQIVQALQITQRNGVVLEREGPVVAFPAKDVGVPLAI